MEIIHCSERNYELGIKINNANQGLDALIATL